MQECLKIWKRVREERINFQFAPNFLFLKLHQAQTERELVIQSQIQGLTKAWRVTNLTAQGWAVIVVCCCCTFFVWWINRNGTFKKLTDIHRWPQSMELFCSCSGGSPYLPRCKKTLFSHNSITRLNIIFSPIFL